MPGAVRDTLLSRFDRTAALRPDAVAVRTDRVSVDYKTLAEASHALAGPLAALAGGRPGPVAVLREPGPGQVCAALAALRCGKPYLPVDPTYPRHRVELILGDAAPAAVVGGTDAGPGGAGGPLDADTLVSSLSMTAGRWGDATRVTEDDAYVIYTSGSSGAPKGIVIQHHSIVNLLDDFGARRRLPAGSRHSTCASPGFDASVWETWMSLDSGGELCVMPEGQRWDATGFVDWLADQGIANAYVPAAFLPVLAQAPGLGIDLRALRRVMAGAEPIPRGLLGGIKRVLPDLMLLNAYGPTEATVCCLAYEVTAADDGPERAPIGTAIRNTDLLVEPLDGASDPTRPGERSGELHVGGAAVGRYLRPERGERPAYYTRTAPDNTPQTYYRTGDLVRRDATGTYTFLGRVDEMVKVRGYRVEPGDVEHTILQLPGVAQAVVLKQTAPETPGADREQLVAHLVPAPGARLDPADVLRRLRERLPWYAIPNGLVLQETLPLTEHGKVDRRALLAGPVTAAAAPAHPVLPRQRSDDLPDRRQLRDLWNGVLGPAADEYSSFLANGGDSLAAGRLTAAVAQRLGRHVRMTDVLLAPGLDELRQTVLRGRRTREQTTGSRQAPLTSAQQGLILEEQLWDVEGAYNESCLFVLPEAVETDRLRAAVAGALSRHPAVGGRVQGGADDPCTAVLRLGGTVDVRTYRLDTPSADPAELTSLADRLRREPLDLESGPLGRAHLIVTREGCVALLLTLHHIVCDTWSLQLLLEDIATGFDGAPLPPTPAATACDYALAQEPALSKSALARRAAALAVIVPGSRREPYLAPSGQVSTLRRTLAEETVTRLKATAARADLTVFAAVCAGFESALAAAVGPGPFLYATPVAQRDDPGFAPVVGCLINTTPIASSVSRVPDDDPAALLAAVGRQVTAALSAAHLPYPELVHALHLRGVHQPPHRFLVIHESPLRLRLTDRYSTGVTLPPLLARSDVCLSVLEHDGRIDAHLCFDDVRIGTRSAGALLDAFETSIQRLSQW